MTAQFSRLARTSASSDATRVIKDLIISGRLRPGDRLPAERELSEMLGISRPTVRESIHALVAMNILETRHGNGTYVRSLLTGELLQPLQFVLSMAKGALRELFEARLVLEPAIAAFAAERATDDQIAQMRQCIGLSHDTIHMPDEFAEHDVELHRLISEASGNQFLASQLASLHALGVESRAVTVRLPNVAESALKGHGLIVDAIAAHKPAAARRAMEVHLERVAAAAAAAAEAASAQKTTRPRTTSPGRASARTPSRSRPRA